MPVYTLNPIPTFEARSINTQADGDAWVAALTPQELERPDDGTFYTNVRIDVDEEAGRFWLRYTRTDIVDGSQPGEMYEDLGGYAIAARFWLNLSVEPKTAFESRYQPYPVVEG